MFNGIILNEKELHRAKARVELLSNRLSSKGQLDQLVIGLPPEIVNQVTEMMIIEGKELTRAIDAYESTKNTHNPAKLVELAHNNPGLTLIIARIAIGHSQKQLAWRLGVKEQQVQRYEADRYSSISMKNYTRIAALLGVRIEATITKDHAFRGLDEVIDDVSKTDIKKILKHGRNSCWFSDEMDEAKLRQNIAENRIQYGSPSLLRTGINVKDHSEDVLLHAWRAQVSKIARNVISLEPPIEFDPLEIRWLPDLVRLSIHDDGPVRAMEMLKKYGILLIYEPQIPGLAIDGATFLEAGVPVIAMTLRKDTIDNFWYTLFHELGHTILHFRKGLEAGFFDQLEADSADKIEKEADLFASNILISEERWHRSTARIARKPSIIEAFAREVGIHPAIVFGRIRKEQENYAIFSNKLGRDTVRKQFSGLNLKG